jgi:hypothetical protein
LKVYRFDKAGVFSEEIEMESKSTLPEYHTFAKPPEAAENQVAIMRSGWVLIDKDTASVHRAENLAEELNKAKLLLNTAINTIRYEKIYQESIAYIFPGDTEPDGIQMRNEVDRQNIQDLVIDASTSPPETMMAFMPASNTLKYMTAQQLIEMGKYLKSRGDAIVSYAWTLKSQVGAATNIEELPDVDVGWPE